MEISDAIREKERVRKLNNKLHQRSLSALDRKFEEKVDKEAPKTAVANSDKAKIPVLTIIAIIGLLLMLCVLVYGLWVLSRPAVKVVSQTQQHEEKLVEVCVPQMKGRDVYQSPSFYRSPSLGDRIELWVPARGQTFIVDGTFNTNSGIFKRGIVLEDRTQIQRGVQSFINLSEWDCNSISGANSAGFVPKNR